MCELGVGEAGYSLERFQDMKTELNYIPTIKTKVWENL